MCVYLIPDTKDMYIQQIMKDVNVASYLELKRKTENRDEWRIATKPASWLLNIKKQKPDILNYGQDFFVHLNLKKLNAIYLI